MKRILSLTRQAVQNYNMIEENDIIGIGVSGGKDSMVLLTALNRLKMFYPIKFDIVAIIIDIGFDNTDYEEIISYIKNLNIRYHIEKTQIKKIVFDEKKEKNPCSLCANLRRGALCNTAIKLGCTKLALGHNRDDANETMLMNLFFNSRISCFEPVTVYSDINLSLIRPIIYLSEGQTKNCITKEHIPVMKKICPNDGVSERESVKTLIKNIESISPKVKTNIFSAITNTEFYKKYEQAKE